MRTFVESRITWRFLKKSIEKTPEATIYTLTMRGQVEDVSTDTTSNGIRYECSLTDLLGDMVAPVATLIITRYNKGGEKIKNHITASILPTVSCIRNNKGQLFFATEEESHQAIRTAAQKVIDAISEPDGFMIPPRLTEAGKGALTALARKRDAELDICRITTKIADRNAA
ncbi:MAG: hypothetical protein Q3986_08105 [Akkermansia sp.]|nr:hypothetical protein [Akkermansia sp.]